MGARINIRHLSHLAKLRPGFCNMASCWNKAKQQNKEGYSWWYSTILSVDFIHGNIAHICYNNNTNETCLTTQSFLKWWSHNCTKLVGSVLPAVLQTSSPTHQEYEVVDTECVLETRGRGTALLLYLPLPPTHPPGLGKGQMGHKW